MRVTAIIFILLAAAPSGTQPTAHYDTLIRNGTVIDGTGSLPYRADVAIANGFIVRVGQLSGSTATDVIDAAGLYVAPGFINLHSHAAPNALPTAENMLRQGVTFEVLNADGGGPTDIAAQLEQAAARGLAINIGANVGFNSAWVSVLGEADRRPAREEIERMRDILSQGLGAGAWGVSAGLDYKPAYYATAEEVVEVVRAAAPWRTIFTNHDRLTPETKYSSRAAIAETIGIGSRAGLVPVITHMKVQGREQGTAAPTLALMTDATRRGNYTAGDVYPYLAGQTGLGALLIPAWAQDGGREAMLTRFRDAAQRARIVAEAEEAMDARFGGPGGVFLPFSRRELTDVMKEWNVGAGEAVVRLLEEGNQGAILRFGSEEDLEKILQHPTTSIACDCGASLPGPGSHPRNQGTYPRVLGRYVRERNVLTWQEAVRKMTMLPAATIGAVDRGAIAPGMAADIAVFDPATVIDRATFEEPSLPSEGIRHVLVNGVVALRDGSLTGATGGRALRRARSMPSRPMTPHASARSVEARGAVRTPNGETWRIALDLRHDASARLASGSLTLRDGSDGPIATIRELGVLQVLEESWASVTAAVQLPTGEWRQLTVVVEASDPWRSDRASSVTLYGLEASGRADGVRISSR